MKLLMLLCITTLMCVHACAQRVSMSLQKASFRNLIKEIEKQSGYSFIYTTEQIRPLPAVTVRPDSIDIPSLLDQLLRNTNISYHIHDRFIVLVSADKKERMLNGKIISQSGTGLAGVTVQMHPGNIIATTNEDGTFMIPAFTAGMKLQISGAEIETDLISPQDSDFIEIRTKQRIKELDETIVVAYGYTTKRYSIGNITKVRIEALNDQGRGNLLNTLQARVPGLLVSSSGGAPGSSYQVQIRGQQSVNPNPLINNQIAPVDQPLILINGIPFAPQNNNVNQLSSLASPGNAEIYNNPYGGISPFSIIDPSDIESVEVLKDAAATSIYGSRAANGIILITTRQPSGNDLNIEAAISTGMVVLPRSPEMFSTTQYLEARKNAFNMDRLQPGLLAGRPEFAPDLLIYDSTKQTDWRKYFYHSAAPVTNVHTGISVKTGRFSLLTTTGYRKESYLLKGDFDRKQASLMNVIQYSSKNDRLKIGFPVYYSSGTNHSVASPVILQAISLPPNHPGLYNADGSVSWRYNNIGLPQNPAAALIQPYAIHLYNLLSSIKAEYFLAKKTLQLRLNAGYNNFKTDETSITPASSLNNRTQGDARSVFAGSRFRTRVIEPQILYSVSRKNVIVKALAGMTLQWNNICMSSQRGMLFYQDSLMTDIINAGRTDSRSLYDSYRYSSYFGRADLIYKGKYLFHFSGRNDQSSRFAKNNDHGTFSSAGFGWILSDESFIKQIRSPIGFAKLRFTIGSAGNDNIGYYHYFDAWTRTGSYTNNQSLPNTIDEASSGWSVTRKFEMALELRLFNERFSFEATLYDHKSKNQLISQSTLQPRITRYIQNFPVSVRNSGWEFIAGVHSIKERRFYWSADINITFPRNRLEAFPQIENSLYQGLYWPGHELDALRLVRYTGIDKQDGTYTFDRQAFVYKSRFPRMYGGIAGFIGYKNWQCDLQIDLRKQNGKSLGRELQHLPAGFMVNQPKAAADYWKAPGDETGFQRSFLPVLSDAQLASLQLMNSDASISDASYLRLKNIQISYFFRRKAESRKVRSKKKIYLQLQNILTLSSASWSDPEAQSLYPYPSAEMIVLGIELKL